ncbi:MAG: class I SAM-dependent methyltransferase [Acidimicrobiia bacterium]
MSAGDSDISFRRQDESLDSYFYSVPRLVNHIDDAAIAALSAAYEEMLSEGDRVLDMMSSWVSHLPAQLSLTVTGLGMNADELAANERLSSFVVHDLNQIPVLPYPDSAFEAAVCAVSVQYLTRPVEVFAEVRRVLVPGGVFVVGFSNRCFPTKAVMAWLYGSDAVHRALVRSYFETAGFVDVVDESRPSTGDPMYVVRGRTPAAGTTGPSA